LLGDLVSLAHVVSVSTGDEDGVDPSDLLDLHVLGPVGIPLDPRIDQDHLPAGGDELEVLVPVERHLDVGRGSGRAGHQEDRDS
jgi:hypothetical protein